MIIPNTLVAVLIVHNLDSQELRNFTNCFPQSVKVTAATTPESAYQSITGQTQLALVFLDAGLAGEDQFDLVTDIRKHQPSAVIILVSSFLNMATLRLSALLHCNDVLQLPVNPDDLLAIVNFYTDKHFSLHN
jgi:CheY-like chemotaxis protein